MAIASSRLCVRYRRCSVHKRRTNRHTVSRHVFIGVWCCMETRKKRGGVKTDKVADQKKKKGESLRRAGRVGLAESGEQKIWKRRTYAARASQCNSLLDRSSHSYLPFYIHVVLFSSPLPSSCRQVTSRDSVPLCFLSLSLSLSALSQPLSLSRLCLTLAVRLPLSISRPLSPCVVVRCGPKPCAPPRQWARALRHRQPHRARAR